jgi:SAM-dependent methyltransferase
MKQFFSKFFPGKKATYLDIGPGQGETLILWRKLGYDNIQSIDISNDVCSHIKKLGFNCELVADSTNFLINNKEKFDFIMLNDVVEHINKDELIIFIEAVFDSLKKNGKVLIKVPNAQSPHFSIGRYGDLTHVQSFTELSLTQLMKLGGFENFKFYPDQQETTINTFLGKYLITPIYFWWIRKIRMATFHNSPEILTQAIILVAKKD